MNIKLYKNIMEDFSEKVIDSNVKKVMATIGANVKMIRLNRKMTRVELAFYCNSTESMICNIENGKKQGISVYTLVKLSNALEVDLHILFM
jgi:transcriptional regulator with XRE-family HTH domain